VNTYVALFRGINVSGHNVIRMKDLVALLEEVGCRDVATYIQSGNVVFRSRARDRVRLARKIAAAVVRSHGFEPSILVLEQAAFENAVRANPFPAATSAPKTLHLFFLAAVPERPDLERLAGLAAQDERFRLDGAVFYLHAPSGIGRSRLASGLERALGVAATGRNWRTVGKIAEMARG
jgi:uncharacterized protein (DUF1697 family)